MIGSQEPTIIVFTTRFRRPRAIEITATTTVIHANAGGHGFIDFTTRC